MGVGYEYNIDGGPYQTSVIFAGIAAGSHNILVRRTTDNTCISGTTAVVVTAATLPTPTINGSITAIILSSKVYTTQAGMSGYIWTVSAGGTITSGAGTNAITVKWNTAGNQTVSVNYTNANSCTAVIPTVINVTVGSNPTIDGPTPVCVNSTNNVYTTEAGMTNYVWTVSPGGTITAGAGTDAITVNWNTVGAQTVSVNYTDGGGITAATPTSYSVTVNSLPVPAITGQTSVCAVTSGNLYTTETGMSGYIWTVSPGGTITSGTGTNEITVTWNTAGAQTVSVNYNNATGCTAANSTVKTVTVNPLPVPTITGSLSAVTSSNKVYTTQAGMSGYIWTVSSGGIITSGAGTNAISVTWNTAGVQTVSVNYSNATGCTPVIPTVINVTVGDNPTIDGPTPVCVNSTNNVYTTEPGMTGYTWTVSAGGVITSGAGTNAITVTWNTVGAQTVSVNYTNGGGITAASPTVYSVTVNSLPVPAITGPTSVCVATATNVYTTEAGMTAYTWIVSPGGSITAGGTATDNTATITWNTAGAQTVSVNYNNANGCTAASPTVKTVTVNSLPVPTITGLTAVPTLSSTVYTTQAGMSAYVWSVSAGGTITAGGTATDNTATITWNTAGVHTVSVNYNNATSCTAVIPTVINVTVGDNPTITGPTPVCVTTTNNVYTTEPGMSAYTWIVSAGGTITAGGTATDNTVTVTWNTAGVQTVSVNYTNGGGITAASPTIYTVTVVSLPVPTITGPSPVCIASTGNVYTTEAGMTAYIWTVSSGGTISAGGTTSDNTATITWNTAGAQTVSVNYNNANGCTAGSPTSKSVTVNSLPTAPTYTLIQPTGSVLTGTITVTTPTGIGMTYSIDGLTYTNTTGIFTELPGTYSITAMNSTGCVSIPSVVIIVAANADLSVVNTVNNEHPIIGKNVVFTIVATNNGPDIGTGVTLTDILQSGYTYVSSTTTTGTYEPSTGVWTIGTMNVSATETLTITATINPLGNYVNTAIIAGNEIDDNLGNNTSTVITYPTDFFIPDGFSPNGDGTNDLFVIRGIFNYPNNKFVIFNRWGNKVYEASPYQNNWDGRSMFGLRVGGDELPIGTYFYVLDLMDGSAIFKGTIYLNR